MDGSGHPTHVDVAVHKWRGAQIYGPVFSSHWASDMDGIYNKPVGQITSINEWKSYFGSSDKSSGRKTPRLW